VSVGDAKEGVCSIAVLDLAMSRSWSKDKGKGKEVHIPELAHSTGALITDNP
jgi:hypothetical protein